MNPYSWCLTHPQFPMISNISLFFSLFKHVQFVLLNSCWSCGQPYSVVNILEVTSLKKTDSQSHNSYQMPMAAHLPGEHHVPLLLLSWSINLLHMVTIAVGFYVQRPCIENTCFLKGILYSCSQNCTMPSSTNSMILDKERHDMRIPFRNMVPYSLHVEQLIPLC